LKDARSQTTWSHVFGPLCISDGQKRKQINLTDQIRFRTGTAVSASSMVAANSLLITATMIHDCGPIAPLCGLNMRKIGYYPWIFTQPKSRKRNYDYNMFANQRAIIEPLLNYFFKN